MAQQFDIINLVINAKQREPKQLAGALCSEQCRVTYLANFLVHASLCALDILVRCCGILHSGHI